MTALKAVCCDLDGTLFSPDHSISDTTLALIKRLQQSGVYFIVATGRPYGDVLPTLHRCGLQPDFVITSNGGRVHDKALRVLVEHNMDEQAVCRLFQLARQPNNDGCVDATCGPRKIVTNVNCNDRWLTNERLADVRAVFDPALEYEEVDPMQFTAQDLRGTHSMWLRGDPQDLVCVQRYIQREFGGQLWCGFATPKVLDCVGAEVSKGRALRDICDILKIDPTHVACFGDGMNDESMLRIAGCPCLMGNAAQALKAALPHAEVVGSNAEDGVAVKVRQLFSL